MKDLRDFVRPPISPADDGEAVIGRPP